MFSARGVALNVTTASVQLRVLHNSVYLSARLKLRGTNLYLPLQDKVTEHLVQISHFISQDGVISFRVHRLCNMFCLHRHQLDRIISIIIITTTLQSFVGPWPLFQFPDPVYSR
jgi:hypothetical protein